MVPIRGYIGVIYGLYRDNRDYNWDNGEENGNDFSGFRVWGLGCRV